ncbi:MAG: hypothetical protein JWP03_4695 [Phycisphaerales bacterium]|nr:hypothetical protein [Phycisphaerales bacterium]
MARPARSWAARRAVNRFAERRGGGRGAERSFFGIRAMGRFRIRMFATSVRFQGLGGDGVGGWDRMAHHNAPNVHTPPGGVRGGFAGSKCCNAWSICVGVICRGQFQRISPGPNGVVRSGGPGRIRAAKPWRPLMRQSIGAEAWDGRIGAGADGLPTPSRAGALTAVWSLLDSSPISLTPSRPGGRALADLLRVCR